MYHTRLAYDTLYKQQIDPMTLDLRLFHDTFTLVAIFAHHALRNLPRCWPLLIIMFVDPFAWNLPSCWPGKTKWCEEISMVALARIDMVAWCLGVRSIAWYSTRPEGRSSFIPSVLHNPCYVASPVGRIAEQRKYRITGRHHNHFPEEPRGRH